MRKINNEDETHFRPVEKSKPVKDLEVLRSWLVESDTFAFQQQPDGVQLLPLHLVADWQGLGKRLRIIQAGTCAGSIKHQKFIPDHALALSHRINHEEIQTANLSKEQALQYLRKENVNLTGLSLGYTLMMYSGLALGWANSLGNRMNNMYPTQWRIKHL